MIKYHLPSESATQTASRHLGEVHSLGEDALTKTKNYFILLPVLHRKYKDLLYMCNIFLIKMMGISKYTLIEHCDYYCCCFILNLSFKILEIVKLD